MQIEVKSQKQSEVSMQHDKTWWFPVLTSLIVADLCPVLTGAPSTF